MTSPRARLPEPAADNCRGKSHTLVIDDDRAVADTLVMVLNAAGLGASAVYSGEAGVALARGVEFEFLVTGVVMPRMNGIEAAIQICQLLPKCKVLLVSGDNDTAPYCKMLYLGVTNSKYSPSRCILLKSSGPFTQ
jgi:DNA-binding NtrC family response regulator